jgi:hypothetical protein
MPAKLTSSSQDEAIGVMPGGMQVSLGPAEGYSVTMLATACGGQISSD